jgi:hypothetical protein
MVEICSVTDGDLFYRAEQIRGRDAMGRFALQFEDDDKLRGQRDKTLIGSILSVGRMLFTTTLLAYLIVLGWMHFTGDATLWRVMGLA